MVGIFCFLLKIHPCRQRVRRLPLLFLGGDDGCAIALLRTVTAEPGMTAAVNDGFGGVQMCIRDRRVRALLSAADHRYRCLLQGVSRHRDPLGGAAHGGGLVQGQMCIRDRP